MQLSKKKTQKRYKFLREGMKSNSGDTVWRIDEWQKHNGKVDLCNAGFHCSKEISQAFSYVQGEILAEVEVRGSHKASNDKEVWSEMRVIKAWKWQKKDSVALSIFAAELVLENFEKVYPDDKRPKEAIEAAKRWLGEPTKANESAALSAAESAAESAALSAALSAAESAALSAALSARSAARSAAWSARSAEKKIIKQIYAWFDEHLSELDHV